MGPQGRRIRPSRHRLSLLPSRAAPRMVAGEKNDLSPFGTSLTGVRENSLRMHAIGAPVYWRLVLVYTLSATIAGVAGA